MTQVATSEVSDLLRAAGGSYVAAFELFVAQEQARTVKRRKPTKADRLEANKAIIETRDELALLEMQEVMSSFVDLINRAGDIDPEHFSDADAVQLMEEYIAFDKIEPFLQAERERIKQIVFEAITAHHRKKGVADPENKNGTIEVEELGRKFCKEGCGTKDPEINQAVLRSAVGEEKWAEVCEVLYSTPAEVVIPQHQWAQVQKLLDAANIQVDAEFVPETVELGFSIEKYMEAAEKDPSLLEKLRQALKVGEAKTPRFVVRDL